MAKILGIDLGTTNSCMAIMEGGSPRVLENKEGARTTPSMVAHTKAGERLVGLLAKRQGVTNPTNTIFSIKRLIGRRYEDDEVQRDVKLLPYKINRAGEGVKVSIGGKDFTPQEVSAMILQKLKQDAETKLGETITEAVITVPAYFDDAQRQATKDAGQIAGLDVKRIINEPTAAALAYGFQSKKDQKIVVYDLGGGTFDVSVLEVAADTVEVRATNGDTHLGGDDFDQVLIQHIIEEYKKESGIDLSKDNLALQRIKEAAEKAKIELSTAQESEINLPFVTSDATGAKHLLMKLTRAKLEDLVRHLVERTMGPCKNALKDAGLEVKDINEVIMVGGMTRMPLVVESVEKFFSKKPNLTVNPDEVVAVGAAVQAGILQGEVKDVLLLDVTPLSLGIETLGGVMTKLIERNSTIPTSKSQIFSTAADNQTSVEIHVLQGEREMTQDNKSLGNFILSGIPPAPRGVPQVEVTFDVDANGILNVKALDKATGKEQKITITASTGLSKDEIARLQREAELHADEDKKRRELIDEKNATESMIYTAEKSLREAGEKVSAEIKQEVEGKIIETKKVLESDSIEDIRAKQQELSLSLQKVGQAMYKDSNGDASARAAQEGETEEKANSDKTSTSEDIKEGEVEK